MFDLSTSSGENREQPEVLALAGEDLQRMHVMRLSKTSIISYQTPPFLWQRLSYNQPRVWMFTSGGDSVYLQLSSLCLSG